MYYMSGTTFQNANISIKFVTENCIVQWFGTIHARRCSCYGIIEME